MMMSTSIRNHVGGSLGRVGGSVSISALCTGSLKSPVIAEPTVRVGALKGGGGGGGVNTWCLLEPKDGVWAGIW